MWVLLIYAVPASPTSKRAVITLAVLAACYAELELHSTLTARRVK